MYKKGDNSCNVQVLSTKKYSKWIFVPSVRSNDVDLSLGEVAFLSSKVTLLRSKVALLSSDVALLPSKIALLSSKVALLPSNIALLQSKTALLSSKVIYYAFNIVLYLLVYKKYFSNQKCITIVSQISYNY